MNPKKSGIFMSVIQNSSLNTISLSQLEEGKKKVIEGRKKVLSKINVLEKDYTKQIYTKGKIYFYPTFNCKLFYTDGSYSTKNITDKQINKFILNSTNDNVKLYSKMLSLDVFLNCKQ